MQRALGEVLWETQEYKPSLTVGFYNLLKLQDKYF